jgi:hypothetical protein
MFSNFNELDGQCQIFNLALTVLTLVFIYGFDSNLYKKPYDTTRMFNNLIKYHIELYLTLTVNVKLLKCCLSSNNFVN